MPHETRNCEDVRPKDVGILAMEIYFPSTCVDQARLEEYDGVSKGKYTIGLGQLQMGFCADNEDINSLCLTVLANLMAKNGISYSQIGRLEVGTETIIDKSKSVKTVLMQLFEESGNFSVEGIDTTNACYGGTSALFNAVSWIESSAWDGRYALVICGDIAVYSKGNARCTGGAGAVAMLLGPDAPMVLEPGLRSTYMRHSYDFYKPDFTSEYPIVDGKLSVESYITALDKCYQGYCQKADQKLERDQPFCLRDFDFVTFHSPFCKLVKKSYARLMLNDFLLGKTKFYREEDQSYLRDMDQYRTLKLADSIFNKEVESAFIAASKSTFNAKTERSLMIASRVGNMYTPSLYSCLVSTLMSHTMEELQGSRIGLFSYGSGLAASMFSLKVRDETAATKASLKKLISGISDVKQRLEARYCAEPEEFTQALKLRAESHLRSSYVPATLPDKLFPGTFYLTEVDEKFRRSYTRKEPSRTLTVPVSHATMNGH